MICRRILLGSLLLVVVRIGSNMCAAEAPEPTPAVKDPDGTIRAQMVARWKKPERLRWRIAYHPIDGMSDRSSWHIEGTHWWVRVNPAWVKLDEFDKTVAYELDAVALDQNYGVIDFYVYEHKKVK